MLIFILLTYTFDVDVSFLWPCPPSACVHRPNYLHYCALWDALYVTKLSALLPSALLLCCVRYYRPNHTQCLWNRTEFLNDQNDGMSYCLQTFFDASGQLLKSWTTLLCYLQQCRSFPTID